MRENWRRSVFKTISWRITATGTTIAIVYVLTGEAILSLGVGSLELLLKTVLYYAHERIWARRP